MTTTNNDKQPHTTTNPYTPSSTTQAARTAKAASPVTALALELERQATNDVQATNTEMQAPSNERQTERKQPAHTPYELPTNSLAI